MEDTLEKASNQHRTIYYSSQLRVMDISQNIRSMGVKLTQNQVKVATTDCYNHFCMLEKIFQQANIPYIYLLIKAINQNYNSLIAVLLEKNYRVSQGNLLKNSSIEKQEEGEIKRSDEGLPNQPNLLKEIKKNKLGGVHLFNENYARYLEDNRILEEIKSQKAKRLHRNRMEILRESIFEELNHKTDVEEFPAKNDEITNYIIKTKDKNSIFNYISYEPELQEILTFFQNSQSEANQFLVRKATKTIENEGNFSFADFQREIQLKNMVFKKQIIEKFKEFVEKYKRKQYEIEKYVSEKQAIFKKLEQKYFKAQDESTQTDLNLNEFIKAHEGQLRDMELKYNALENMKKEELSKKVDNDGLIHVLALKENQIDKLNIKIGDLQSSIEYVKKLLRQEKNKKFTTKDQLNLPKSQKTIPDNVEKQKIVEILPSKKDIQKEQSINEPLDLNSTQQLRKTSYLSNTWRRKQSNDASILSFNELDKDVREHEISTREKKKYVRYNIDNKLTQNEKIMETSSISFRPKNVQSSQCYVQTEHMIEGQMQQTQLRTIQVQTLRGLEDDKKSKSSRSTPKRSNNNLDLINLNKNNSSQKLQQVSKMIKDKTQITSLSKIKSQENSAYKQPETTKDNKSHKEGSKKEEIKLDRLNFVKPQTIKKQNDAKATQKKEIQGDTSVEPITKAPQKKDQITYQIYEVVEQQGEEQKDTIKNTERSQKIVTLLSHKKLESELIEKLSKEMNKIKQQKNYRYQQLYSIMILPLKQENKKIDWSKQLNKSLFRESKSLNKVKQSQYTNAVQHQGGKENHKVAIVFDQLIKNESSSQAKKEKLKNWKKKIMHSIKAQLISKQQAEEIALIINQSAKIKGFSSIHQDLASPLASVPPQIRNSLPDIRENIDNLQVRNRDNCFRKSKLKTSCEDKADNLKLQEVNIFQSDFQQNMDELITEQYLKPNFKQKFVKLHKRCEEGTICSHINRYFEAIIKQFEQRRRKSKQSLVLPIQHIGTRTEVEQLVEKGAKKSAKVISSEFSNGKLNNIQKQVHLTKGNLGLSRQRYSQDLILPIIEQKHSQLHKVKMAT